MVDINLRGQNPCISAEKTKFDNGNYVVIEAGVITINADILDAEELQEQLDTVLHPDETREDLLRKIDELEQMLEKYNKKGAA